MSKNKKQTAVTKMTKQRIFHVSDDLCKSIRNVKFLKSTFLKHAFFCHVGDRSLFFILTQVEMAEE